LSTLTLDVSSLLACTAWLRRHGWESVYHTITSEDGLGKRVGCRALTFVIPDVSAVVSAGIRGSAAGRGGAAIRPE
jgi:hypothetical protein